MVPFTHSIFLSTDPFLLFFHFLFLLEYIFIKIKWLYVQLKSYIIPEFFILIVELVSYICCRKKDLVLKRKKMAIALRIGMSLLLGGCFNLENTQEKKVETQGEKHASEYYVPVQDYTGKGFALPNGERTDKIAKAHRGEIEVAVKNFFKEKYKTDVIVHNVVGAVDGASVFVESVGELHFYTYAIVPIDVQNNKVMLDEVWSQEGQVEGAIRSGIYGLVYNDQLIKLNSYLNDFVSKNPVVGMRMEAVENVRASGYSTSYYYIPISNKLFTDLYELYITNPNTSKEQFISALNNSKVDPNYIDITIDLFMKEKRVKPDKKIFDQIVLDIEDMEGLPPGSYSIFLHDNNVDKRTGMETNDTSLERTFPHDIVKK